MLTMTKSLFALMIGFIATTIFGLIMIPILKKIKVRQRISIYVGESHQKKSGTPTMGGIIFLLPALGTTILLLLTNKIEMSISLAIILFVCLSQYKDTLFLKINCGIYFLMRFFTVISFLFYDYLINLFH